MINPLVLTRIPGPTAKPVLVVTNTHAYYLAVELCYLLSPAKAQ